MSIKFATRIFVTLFLCSIHSHGAIWTSYLHIEVPGVDTVQFNVTYETDLFADPNQITSFDLMTCVFGIGVADGPNHLLAGDSSGNAVGYDSSFAASFGLFVDEFVLNGTSYQSTFTDTWYSFVSGGSGENAAGFGVPGSYIPGIWTVSADGISSRYISDGSYDAWTLTTFDSFTFIPDSTPSVEPSLPDFDSTIEITHIPEPSSILLVALSLFPILRRKKSL